ncbi:MAPK regulated corepressor interacting protein 2 [Numida meleagris]|uniref:MAPK regulated corepressor interacting protein 2 n=1 Tax=Numida meleagris TaxID=8996 RepID=UPI000B3E296B|nr:MAPK regulated corepressor interacting protein 2 [Numida meleagris]
MYTLTRGPSKLATQRRTAAGGEQGGRAAGPAAARSLVPRQEKPRCFWAVVPLPSSRAELEPGKHITLLGCEGWGLTARCGGLLGGSLGDSRVHQSILPLCWSGGGWDRASCAGGTEGLRGHILPVLHTGLGAAAGQMFTAGCSSAERIWCQQELVGPCSDARGAVGMPCSLRAPRLEFAARAALLPSIPAFPSPAQRLIFNRVNSKRSQVLLLDTSAPKESYTAAHEENVRFVYEAWQEVEQQLDGEQRAESAHGPVQYVEKTPNPRLKDFVPIDLEEWWANQFLAKV